MEAISNRSGKVFTGKLAELMLRVGAARPAGETKPEKVIKVQPKKAATQKPKPKVKK